MTAAQTSIIWASGSQHPELMEEAMAAADIYLGDLTDPLGLNKEILARGDQLQLEPAVAASMSEGVASHPATQTATIAEGVASHPATQTATIVREPSPKDALLEELDYFFDDEPVLEDPSSPMEVVMPELSEAIYGDDLPLSLASGPFTIIAPPQLNTPTKQVVAMPGIPSKPEVVVASPAFPTSGQTIPEACIPPANQTPCCQCKGMEAKMTMMQAQMQRMVDMLQNINHQTERNGRGIRRMEGKLRDMTTPSRRLRDRSPLIPTKNHRR